MSLVNRRRRSILKSTRQSIGTNASTVEGGVWDDSSNFTGTLPGGRKRVSFGQKQIKEFQLNLSKSPQPTPNKNANKTTISSVGMDTTFGHDVTFFETDSPVASGYNRNLPDKTIAGEQDMDMSLNNSMNISMTPDKIVNKTTISAMGMNTTFGHNVTYFGADSPVASAYNQSRPRMDKTIAGEQDMDMSINTSNISTSVVSGQELSRTTRAMTRASKVDVVFSIPDSDAVAVSGQSPRMTRNMTRASKMDVVFSVPDPAAVGVISGVKSKSTKRNRIDKQQPPAAATFFNLKTPKRAKQGDKSPLPAPPSPTVNRAIVRTNVEHQIPSTASLIVEPQQEPTPLPVLSILGSEKAHGMKTISPKQQTKNELIKLSAKSPPPATSSPTVNRAIVRTNVERQIPSTASFIVEPEKEPTPLPVSSILGSEKVHGMMTVRHEQQRKDELINLNAKSPPPATSSPTVKRAIVRTNVEHQIPSTASFIVEPEQEPTPLPVSSILGSEKVHGMMKVGHEQQRKDELIKSCAKSPPATATPFTTVHQAIVRTAFEKQISSPVSFIVEPESQHSQQAPTQPLHSLNLTFSTPEYNKAHGIKKIEHGQQANNDLMPATPSPTRTDIQHQISSPVSFIVEPESQHSQQAPTQPLHSLNLTFSTPEYDEAHGIKKIEHGQQAKNATPPPTGINVEHEIPSPVSFIVEHESQHSQQASTLPLHSLNLTFSTPEHDETLEHGPQAKNATPSPTRINVEHEIASNASFIVEPQPQHSQQAPSPPLPLHPLILSTLRCEKVHGIKKIEYGQQIKEELIKMSETDYKQLKSMCPNCFCPEFWQAIDLHRHTLSSLKFRNFNRRVK